MTRSLLGLAPFFEHSGRYAFEFIDLFLRLRVGDKFQAVTIRIKKVNGLEDPVVGRADHIQAFRLDVRLRLEQGVIILDFDKVGAGGKR